MLKNKKKARLSEKQKMQNKDVNNINTKPFSEI